MKLGALSIIGDPVDDRVCLKIDSEVHRNGRTCVVDLDPEQFERLITYLKGLRDGMGWNDKSAEDRSL